MFIFIQKFTPIAIVASFLSLGNLITANSANAYSVTFGNGDFENSTSLNGTAGWTGIGSTEITGTYSNVNPYNTQQGVITTACPNSNSTFCQNSRNDDPPTATGTFNLLGKDQLSASPEIHNLQDSLGLSPNALSIPREFGGTPLLDTEGKPLYRTPKEGSAIFQNIEIFDDGNATDTRLTFNYDFLTNDGSGDLGDKDFGFFSISGNGVQEIVPLEDSTGTIPTASGSNFATNNNTYQSYAIDKPLTPGTYKVGFGVVDVDGSGYSSALALDNFNAEAVPFDFSPTAGLGLVAGIFGLTRLRRKFQRETD